MLTYRSVWHVRLWTLVYGNTDQYTHVQLAYHFELLEGAAVEFDVALVHGLTVLPKSLLYLVGVPQHDEAVARGTPVGETHYEDTVGAI